VPENTPADAGERRPGWLRRLLLYRPELRARVIAEELTSGGLLVKAIVPTSVTNRVQMFTCSIAPSPTGRTNASRARRLSRSGRNASSGVSGFNGQDRQQDRRPIIFVPIVGTTPGDSARDYMADVTRYQNLGGRVPGVVVRMAG